MRIIKPLIIGAVALAVCGAQPPNQNLPPVPANGEMGFVMTAFSPAIFQSKLDCPDGLAGTVKENFLDQLAAPERARLSLPANEAALKSAWQSWSLGPNNTNLCANPELFPSHATRQTVQGKIAPGLDLDGGKAACGHEEFTSPSGLTGVDNEAYRVLGCSRNYHGVDGVAGDATKGLNGLLATGENSMVVRLNGVDNLVKDDAVTVLLASTDDRPILDARQNYVTGASFTAISNPAWNNMLKGQIRNGILTTEPQDIRLTRRMGHGGYRGERAEWDLRRARIRVAFQPDGSITGVLGAYQTPRNVILSTINGGVGAALVAGIDCAAQYNTMLKYADGDRDPKTGKCTSISVALDIAAVPAFVFDRQAAKVAAQ